MEKTQSRNNKFSFIFFIGLTVATGLFYSFNAKAYSPFLYIPPSHVIIEHHYYDGDYGYDESPADLYYGPRHYHRNVERTSWRYSGHGCQEVCLIDRWSGEAINCHSEC